MGIHHLTAPGWMGEGEYRFAFYEGQVYGLENTLISIFFLLIVVIMIKKIFFGSKMKHHMFLENVGRIAQYQHILGTNNNGNNQHSRSNYLQRTDHLDEDQEDEVLSSDSIGRHSSEVYFWARKKQYSFCQRIFNFFINVLMWCFGFCTSYLFALASGFGHVEAVSSVLCCIMLFVMILYFTLKSGVRSPACFIFLSLLAICASIFPTVFFQDICICNNSDSGYLVNEGQYLSTSFTRSQQLRQPCPKDLLCHLYVTLPENTHDQLILNAQTGTNIESLHIILIDTQTQEIMYDKKQKSEESIDMIDSHGERSLFFVHIKDLQPNKMYQVLVYDSQTQMLLRVTKYKTLPSKEQVQQGQQIRMAFGGDWSLVKHGVLLNQRLVDANPDVIIFGGNIASDNGMKTCYHPWDIFLENFENQIFEPLDRLVPFIFSVGNKDVGVNSQNNFNITISQETGPYFFSWFPQSINADGKISPIEDRQSFHAHLIGNIALFALDTGYIMSYDKFQLDWLQSKSIEFKSYFKYALYHYSIYPPCIFKQNKWDTPASSIDGQRVWVPIFDKYKFVAAIENHSKQFKRTHPLQASLKKNGGTVYFGDGNWGSEPRECNHSSEFSSLFAKLFTHENVQHFWLAIIDDKKAKYDAYSFDSKLYLDNDFEQNFEEYSEKEEQQNQENNTTNLQ